MNMMDYSGNNSELMTCEVLLPTFSNYIFQDVKEMNHHESVGKSQV